MSPDSEPSIKKNASGRKSSGAFARTSYPPSIGELEIIAKELRRKVLKMIFIAGSGHQGGSLSEIEILASLYFRVLRIDPENPGWKSRDRFILSKSHACPGLYAVLAQRGFFPEDELNTFRKINSRLQGHAHIKTPGVEMSGGSLGQGLSFGLGCALAARVDSNSYHTYVLLGDGECDEGQIWEAAMAAAHYELENLTVVVDRNRIQNDRFTDEVMKLEPLADKWKAFGWNVLKTDGHDFPSLIYALDSARKHANQPTVIIADTVKGKGVSFMENNPAFHASPPTQDDYNKAMIELE